MKKSLQQIIPIAAGVAKLLHPFAEVVLHDLETDKIQAIFNSFSKRQIGDSSYLDRMDLNQAESIIGPYEKINWDGTKLKSVSTVIRDSKGKAEGFLCINLDYSVFENFKNTLEIFLNTKTAAVAEEQVLFQDDLYEQINKFVQNYCAQQNLTLATLDKTKKRSLILLLRKQGAFTGKNAATYIARILGVSRATIYNYLRSS